MAKFLHLALWNANGLSQYTEELRTFIPIHNIEVMLVTEMRFTEKSYLKLSKYTAIIRTIQPELLEVVLL
jgi:hypothetical protein